MDNKQEFNEMNKIWFWVSEGIEYGLILGSASVIAIAAKIFLGH